MSYPPEAAPPKKRKHQPQSPGADPAAKKRRQEDKAKRKEERKRDKGKGKQVSGTSGSTTDHEFVVVASSLVVSIPPVFASDARTGAEEMLDSMVMRYIPALRGVVLSHSNLSFLDTHATIEADCPFSICNVGFDAMVWSPRVGMKLEGKVNLCSPDHISLLVHRTFNVSIPRHHIPAEEWEFEYGPAENDPEFGPDAPQDVNMEAGKESADESANVGGKWIHRGASRVLGVDSQLEFVVIGMTVANEMLSLTGSIQPDPFSPDHQPQTSPTKKPPEAEPEEEVVVEEDVSRKEKKKKKKREKEEGGEKKKKRKKQEEEE